MGELYRARLGNLEFIFQCITKWGAQYKNVPIVGMGSKGE